MRKISLKRQKQLRKIRKYNKGGGDSYLFIVMFLFISFAFFLIGGKILPDFEKKPSDIKVVISPMTGISKNALQIQTLYGVTVAPSPTLPDQPSCDTTTSDSVLVIDHSSSMKGNALAQAKSAAGYFVDIVSANPASRVGLVQFDENGDTLSALTSDYTIVKNKINEIPESSGTCIQCGLKNANIEIQNSLRAGIKKANILLSDGRANRINGTKSDNADSAALQEAISGNAANGTIFYTIGFAGEDSDDDVNAALLQSIANQTGGKYYFAPTQNELAGIFAEIAQQICL